jgi:hypothetical protein
MAVTRSGPMGGSLVLPEGEAAGTGSMSPSRGGATAALAHS